MYTKYHKIHQKVFSSYNRNVPSFVGSVRAFCARIYFLVSVPHARAQHSPEQVKLNFYFVLCCILSLWKWCAHTNSSSSTQRRAQRLSESNYKIDLHAAGDQRAGTLCCALRELYFPRAIARRKGVRRTRAAKRPFIIPYVAVSVSVKSLGVHRIAPILEVKNTHINACFSRRNETPRRRARAFPTTFENRTARAPPFSHTQLFNLFNPVVRCASTLGFVWRIRASLIYRHISVEIYTRAYTKTFIRVRCASTDRKRMRVNNLCTK